jgi:hypothetical protein
MQVSELSDEELEAQAKEWRLAALRGSKEARGHAHVLEVELRRRRGFALQRSNVDLDLRPLDQRDTRPRD